MPIINFSHQKGGVGKSLLSYHLAYLLKDNYDVQLLDLDNQKSLSSIHKLRNHKLQQHSIPIKTVHSKHELIDLINSIDDHQYLIIDSGGFDSLYTRLVSWAVLFSPIVVNFWLSACPGFWFPFGFNLFGSLRRNFFPGERPSFKRDPLNSGEKSFPPNWGLSSFPQITP